MKYNFHFLVRFTLAIAIGATCIQALNQSTEAFAASHSAQKAKKKAVKKSKEARRAEKRKKVRQSRIISFCRAPVGFTAIKTFEQLNAIRTVVEPRKFGNVTIQQITGNYFLCNDITIPAGTNFEPIGRFPAIGFGGVLDGNGRAIIDLNIKSLPNGTTPGRHSGVGLFSWILDNGVVKNLALRRPKIQGLLDLGKTGTGDIFIRAAFVGGIAGVSYGTISNVGVEGPGEISDGIQRPMVGTISFLDLAGIGGIAGVNLSGKIENVAVTNNLFIAGDDRVGGVAGISEFNLSLGKLPIIKTARVNANVLSNSRGGGIIGENEGELLNSVFDGTVRGIKTLTDGFDIDRHGGLVGENAGIIKNSTVRGSVEGDQSVGGLVGFQLASIGINNQFTTVSQSSAYGLVRGREKVGGAIGWLLRQGYDSNGRKALPPGVLIQIDNCLANATVVGIKSTGALIGLTDSINARNVLGLGALIHLGPQRDPTTGGLYGLVNGPAIGSGAFFNTSSNQARANEFGATPLSAEALKNLATYQAAGYNISLLSDALNTTWEIDAGGKSFPLLSVVPQ